MTQTDAETTPQDDYDDLAGGPGAPIPIAQLVVCLLRFVDCQGFLLTLF